MSDEKSPPNLTRSQKIVGIIILLLMCCCGVGIIGSFFSEDTADEADSTDETSQESPREDSQENDAVDQGDREEASEPEPTWVEVFRFEAEGRAESERFQLNGGQVRLRYIVTVSSQTEGRRVADIHFQDERLNTESSRIDTTVYIDNPGEGTYDIGERRGEFFLITNVRLAHVADPRITVVVEELR